MYRLDSRFRLIIESLDPEEIVDILELTSEDIVSRFHDVIEEKLERFSWVLDKEEEDDDELTE